MGQKERMEKVKKKAEANLLLGKINFSDIEDLLCDSTYHELLLNSAQISPLIEIYYRLMVELSKHLTDYIRSTFIAIPVDEFKINKNKIHPKFAVFKRHLTDIERFVKCEVLSQGKNYLKRSLVIERWSHILRLCYEQRNFATSVFIAAALNAVFIDNLPKASSKEGLDSRELTSKFTTNLEMHKLFSETLKGAIIPEIGLEMKPVERNYEFNDFYEYLHSIAYIEYIQKINRILFNTMPPKDTLYIYGNYAMDQLIENFYQTIVEVKVEEIKRLKAEKLELRDTIKRLNAEGLELRSIINKLEADDLEIKEYKQKLRINLSYCKGKKDIGQKLAVTIHSEISWLRVFQTIHSALENAYLELKTEKTGSNLTRLRQLESEQIPGLKNQLRNKFNELLKNDDDILRKLSDSIIKEENSSEKKLNTIARHVFKRLKTKKKKSRAKVKDDFSETVHEIAIYASPERKVENEKITPSESDKMKIILKTNVISILEKLSCLVYEDRAKFIVDNNLLQIVRSAQSDLCDQDLNKLYTSLDAMLYALIVPVKETSNSPLSCKTSSNNFYSCSSASSNASQSSSSSYNSLIALGHSGKKIPTLIHKKDKRNKPNSKSASVDAGFFGKGQRSLSTGSIKKESSPNIIKRADSTSVSQVKPG